jgi:hypothetical protein
MLSDSLIEPTYAQLPSAGAGPAGWLAQHPAPTLERLTCAYMTYKAPQRPLGISLGWVRRAHVVDILRGDEIANLYILRLSSADE